MKAHFSPLAVVLAVGVGLSSCSHGGGITCPSVRKYSPAFLTEANKELDMIQDKAPNIIIMVNDYGVTRDAIRKCIELRGK